MHLQRMSGILTRSMRRIVHKDPTDSGNASLLSSQGQMLPQERSGVVTRSMQRARDKVQNTLTDSRNPFLASEHLPEASPLSKSQMLRQEVPGPLMKITQSGAQKASSPQPLNRVHRRVIVEDYGKPLHMASSHAAMLVALEDAIIGR
jgi:Fungal protein kinase